MRSDHCPGALRTFDASDGAIARVRLAGAPLTIDQARGIGDVAEQLGTGEVWFTTRANVQVRGLDDDGAAEFARVADALGLVPSPSHERARNIVVSPFAPRDVLTLAHEIDAALCERPALARLSGRFLMGVDDGSGDLLSLPLDIGLQVHGLRVRLHLGGDVRAYEVGALDAPATAAARVADIAETFLALAETDGAWNVVDLSAEAADELHARVEGLLPAAGSLHVVRSQPALAGAAERIDGTRWLCATAPLARIPVAGWQTLVDIAAQGDGEIRVTPWHAVVVGGVPAEEADAALARLAATGWVVTPDSAWVGVHGCTGAPQCARSLTPVHDDTRALVTEGPYRMPISLVGCARRCGHPSVEHVDIVAIGPTEYELSIHDGTRGPQRATMRRTCTDDLPGAVRDLIAEHLGSRGGDQDTGPVQAAGTDERQENS